MQSRKLGLGVAAAGIAVAVVLFVVLNGDSSDFGTGPGASNPGRGATTGSGAPQGGGGSAVADEPVITVRDGAPVGGVAKLAFDKGEEIRFEVRSDAAYEIHFHGYDVMRDVPADGKVSFDVPASADGIYEVEIEDTATQIAEITVNP